MVRLSDIDKHIVGGVDYGTFSIAPNVPFFCAMNETELYGNWIIQSYRQAAKVPWVAIAQRQERVRRRLLNAEGFSREEAVKKVKARIPTEATE